MEEWVPVIDWEGLYEVSDRGRVRSLSREIEVARNGSTFIKVVGGKLLSPGRYESGHLYVNLHRNNEPHPRRVHHLVLEAFVERQPVGALGLHRDDDPNHNWLSNLYWGSYSDNQHDKVRNGNHHNANKTQCPAGHDYTPENVYWCNGKSGQVRRCKACARKRYLAKKTR